MKAALRRHKAVKPFPLVLAAPCGEKRHDKSVLA